MPIEADERYDIAFAGECLEGHDAARVKKALGALFKANEETVERLFSGKRQRIKRSCDKATARKYQQSMAAAGAKAIISRATGSASPLANDTTNSPHEAEAGDKIATKRTSDFEVLPGGSDILRPDERTQHPPLTPDVSHLSLAAPGDRLGAKTMPPAATVQAPDFELADAGSQLGPEPGGNLPQSPDTSALELAPAGANLVGPSGLDKDSPAPISIEHLNLASVGSELLRVEERKVSDAQAPDTTHLALDSRENEPDN